MTTQLKYTDEAAQVSQTIRDLMSPAVRDMPPSGIRKFFGMVDGQKDIISLGVGEPDFVTPKHVRQAAIHALHKGKTTYTPNAGLPELREAIADYIRSSFQVSYDPEDEVLVTVGSSEAIDLALRTFITPGDEVLVPVPCYISYSPITQLSGGRTVEIETLAENQFKLTAEALRSKLTPRSKVLILCYPNNPTGGIMTYEDWLPIAELIEENNLIVISDEIYAELTYEGKHVSLAAVPGMKDRTIMINGFSKGFAMTGWRVGYACGHPEIIAAMLKIHQYTIMCAPIVGQIAALDSLKNGLEEKDRMIASYNERRQMVVKGFREMGLPCHEPLGAFYVFPQIANTGLTSEQFAHRLLHEAKVVAVPGDVFGQGGEGFIRCSYASSKAKLQEALERIAAFLKKL